MFETIANSFKIEETRKKILFILFILAVYRMGTQVLLPGIDKESFDMMKEVGTGGTLFNLIAGGGFASVFALGIGPYITASIIMQLLTVALPYFEQLKKEGEEGRKKINKFTKIFALVLATLQSVGTVYSMQYLFVEQSTLYFVSGVISMVTGTIVVMWLGDTLTEYGMGNGSSLIIFANIISGLPAGIGSLYMYVESGGTREIVTLIMILIVFVMLIVFVIHIQNGERRIPVKHSKVQGSKMLSGQDQYIPLKVNIAGVMSIIFSLSILQFPMTVSQFVQHENLDRMAEFLNMQSLTGSITYIILIFVFTFFYTSFAINPVEIAENMKKNASFIPGIRPGKPTSDYIQKSVDRLSWIGASFYALIAITPIFMQSLVDINISFGGTTLLIVSGVALELIKQLESQMLMRHYKGFLG